jgi:hypothetical protein
MFRRYIGLNNFIKKFDMSKLKTNEILSLNGVCAFERRNCYDSKCYVTNILTKFGMDGCNPYLVPMHDNVKLLANMDSKEVDPIIYKKILGKLIHRTITR